MGLSESESITESFRGKQKKIRNIYIQLKDFMAAMRNRSDYTKVNQFLGG